MLIEAMPLNPTSMDIGLRLLLTFLAGAVIGLDRQAGGHSAGFRTTVLVGLAACLAMIQANVLLSEAVGLGEHGARMDILRFPLGVLTGVGFLGGGAILKRGSMVTGVTTAATIWIMTAIGLCFGGGQIALGVVATVLCVIVLAPLKLINQWMRHAQDARITVQAPAETMPDLQPLVGPDVEIRFIGKVRVSADAAEFSFQLRWKARGDRDRAGALVAAVEQGYQVSRFLLADEAD